MYSNSLFQEVAMGSVKKRVARRVAEYSDDEDYEIGRGEGSRDDVVMPKSSKRIRHQDRNFAHEGADSDVDAEGEVDIEGIEDDTRFLPDAIQPETKATSRLSKSKHRPEAPLPSASKKRSSGKVKRAVVYSDDEDEDEYGARGEQMDDGDDFELDPAPKRSGLMNTGRGRGSGARISKMKVEKEITIKDERKPLSIPAVAPAASSYGAKRTRMKEEEDVTGVPHSATINEEIPSLVKEPDPTPPPTKKRKLPPIKKNKSTTGSAASSTPTTKPPVKLPLDKKDDISLVRKPAGSTNNADFDLRDASVYASLFTKVGTYS